MSDIQWAAKVLNERQWEGADNWTVDPRGGVIRQWRCLDETTRLTEFVAIAIAKEIDRQACRDMPATRELMRTVAYILEYPEDDRLLSHFDQQDLRAVLAEWKA